VIQVKKKKEKKTFKKINVDSETFDKISYISKALGKKKSQLLREVFEALFKEAKGLKHANLKTMTTVLNGIVFTFEATDTYSIGVNEGKTLEKIKRQKRV